MTKQKLLVPVDYSDGSRHALEYALSLAARLPADVHVLYVWECMPRPPHDIQVQSAEQGSRSLFDLIQENAEAEMATFLAQVPILEQVQCSHSIVSGEPSARILEVAKAE